MKGQIINRTVFILAGTREIVEIPHEYTRLIHEASKVFETPFP